MVITVNMALSGSVIQRMLWPKAKGSHSTPVFPPLKLCRAEMKKLPAQAFKRRGMIKNIPLHLVTSAISSSDIGSVSSDSSLQIIKAFYSSINTKDLKNLKALMAEDCFFDDFSFPTPFQGKKVCLFCSS